MAQILIDSGHRTHLAVCQETGCTWRSGTTTERHRTLAAARAHELQAHPAAGPTAAYRAVLRHAERD